MSQSTPPPGFEAPVTDTSARTVDELVGSPSETEMTRSEQMAAAFSVIPLWQKTALIAGTLAICAICVALLSSDQRAEDGQPTELLGADRGAVIDDTGVPVDTSPAADNPGVADVDATAAVRAAQTAIETYATDHGGSYVGAGPLALRAIDGSLPETLAVTSTEAGYTITVPDGGDGVSFSIERDPDGSVSSTCTPPGTGACPADGTWLGS